MSEYDSTDSGTAPVIPYLCVHDAAAAIDLYREALGAVEVDPRFVDSGGRVGHAEIRIGDAMLMLSDEYPDMGVVSPQTLGNTSCALVLHVPDVDAVAEQAVAAGMTLEQPVEDKFHGARSGTFRDPFGHRWMLMTQVREVPAADIEAAAEEFSRT